MDEKQPNDEYVPLSYEPTEEDAIAGMGDVIRSATTNGITDVDEEE